MKKRIACLFLSLLMLSGCGCNSSNEPTGTTVEPTEAETVYTPQRESDAEILNLLSDTQRIEDGDYTNQTWWCYAEYPQIYLNEEHISDYEELHNNLMALNVELRTEAQSSLGELSVWAEDAASNGSVMTNLFEETGLYVKRADSIATSFLFSYCVFSGGAHPNYGYWGKNFDSVTGEELTLSDVITDTSVLPALLEEKLAEKYPDIIFHGDVKTQFEEYTDMDYSWTLGYEGVTFYFSPYEIASYADGLLSVTIGFKEEDIFNEKYTDAAVDYMVGIYSGEAFDIDTNRDTIADVPVSLYALSDSYGEYISLIVEVDGNAQEYEIYGYNVEYYYIHSGAKQYLWALITSDGCNDIITFEITADEVKKVNEKTIGGVYYPLIDLATYGDEGFTYVPVALTNPNHILLEERIDMIGTNFGLKSYYIDKVTGVCKSDDEAYVITDNETVLTLKRDITVECLVDDTTVTLEAGTELKFDKSDGSTYVDMYNVEDAYLYRIKVSDNMVDGIDIDECFDGIMYAG